MVLRTILLVQFVFTLLLCNSQNVSNCINAPLICNNTTFSISPIVPNPWPGPGLPSGLTVSNPYTNIQNVNSGCLLDDASNPYWFIFTVINNGFLGFSFGDSTTAWPQAGFFDWSLWNYTSATCNQIFSNTIAPVSCNWNGAAAGGTGMYPIPPGGDSSNYQPSIAVTAGQQFVILFSNYSGVNQLITFKSTGTASIGCNITGASEKLSTNDFFVYPNPANEVLTIERSALYNTNLQMQIHNNLGQLLCKEELIPGNKSILLNVKDLPNGVYTLSILTKEKHLVHKRIVISR